MTRSDASAQTEWRMAPPALLFGRYELDDRLHVGPDGRRFVNLLEIVRNNTKAAIQHGRPLVRCLHNAGGSESVAYPTQVVGGRDDGISTDGCFLNFAGVSPVQVKDHFAGTANRMLFLFFPSITTGPNEGSILTQANSLATGEVMASSTLYNYVIIRDLNTGTWNEVDIVTDDDGNLAPEDAQTIPIHIYYGSELMANVTHPHEGAIIWCLLRGYAEVYWVGDPSVAGFNGIVNDGTPGTWSPLTNALVRADYQLQITVGETDYFVNPDNIIAFACEEAQVDAQMVGFKHKIVTYMRADEPLVYVGSTETVPNQGHSPDPELPEQI